jgi:hypothetical protein
MKGGAECEHSALALLIRATELGRTGVDRVSVRLERA